MQRSEHATISLATAFRVAAIRFREVGTHFRAAIRSATSRAVVRWIWRICLGGCLAEASSGRGGGRARRGEDARAEITVGFEVAAEGGEHGLTLQSGSQVEHITVKIPAGIEDGQTIRLAGQGNPGTGGGPCGDLLVTVHVAAHPWFRREGLNVLVDVPVTCMEAVLGGKIDVPTLTEGEFLLSIPPGTNSGRRLRLKGKGIRNTRTGERGDLFAVVKITVPSEVSEESRSLFRQLAELHPENPRAGVWSHGAK